MPGPFADDVPDRGVVRLPRIEAGRVVLRRRAWLTRAAAVPAHDRRTRPRTLPEAAGLAPWRDTEPPAQPTTPPPTGRTIPLRHPDPDRAAREDRTFTDVLESRASRRAYGEQR
ncbi:hypothetical protein [Streptomyces sp. ME19-01-6]|uniref:hypothetical protein n=1 Tax=Streptomyces sp. ME19-01-6 TaxID=3028686 RepID=UPI0029ABE280|nr:hypothetical protein [Streptomyces sp. ME19-01-6]MDX3229032.1 hypothetical protein [Streptomyces sp. ME19-01-6]